MTLKNLERIGKLQTHEATVEEISRLSVAARRNLSDAHHEDISAESRFDMAYKAIMQYAIIALMGNGYRHAASEPGHHATLIQSLPTTVGLSNERMVVLDKLRKKRNLNDYLGENLGEEEVAACIRSAENLAETVEQWLRTHRPDLAIGDGGQS